MLRHPVLDSLRPVVGNSAYVRTNARRIEEAGSSLADFSFPAQDYGESFPDLDKEGTIQFAFVLNSINFQYGDRKNPGLKFGMEYGGKHFDGFFGLAYSLRKAVEDGVPVLDAKYLENLSGQNALGFLKRNIEIPMFAQRVSVLNQIGKVLAERYDGQFSNFLSRHYEEFGGGFGLVEFLAKEFPPYNDVQIFRPTNTPAKFYKKAQLLFAMLHYNVKADFKLKDIGELTVFADYRLPQALRDLGILGYSSELAGKIDNFIPIPEGSDEEIEIRAHTICASDILCKEVNRHRKDKITPNQIDEYLWYEGKKSPKPRHFTQTIFY